MKARFKRLLRTPISGFSFRFWLISSVGTGVVLTWAVGWQYGIPITAVVTLYALAGMWLVNRPRREK